MPLSKFMDVFTPVGQSLGVAALATLPCPRRVVQDRGSGEVLTPPNRLQVTVRTENMIMVRTENMIMDRIENMIMDRIENMIMDRIENTLRLRLWVGSWQG